MPRIGLKTLADERLPQCARPRPDSARQALRHATAQAHARVDALFSRFDLTSREGYGAFLLAQAGAHLAVEQALDAAGATRVIPDWPQRRRGDALRRDLREMGLHEPAALQASPLSGPVQVWGATYVLEGSRLGGALLKRSVPADFPTAFLAPGTPGAWRAFVALLDASLATPDSIDSAVVAAIAAFDVFERSARIALERPRP